MNAFPIVGIGASAGGLEAFSKVLSQIPVDSAMAYVLVQHLDPTHESILPELLGRATAAPVVVASDGLRIEPGNVYVIPPNVGMTLTDGHLRLRPREEKPHLPIDDFLASMAEVQQHNAVAVILSGSGTDGARGTEAVKGEGGITFAQEPADARWDSMPRSAIATTCVDFILPADEIGRRLNDIARHWQQHPDGDTASSSEPLAAIVGLLKQQTAVDFAHYKEATVQRRILRRMVLRRVKSMEDYVALARREPDEITALYQDLLIQVTRFFRDPDAFKSLTDDIFPRIIAARQPDAPIRIWVPGCSGGEESYSIAIAMMEALGSTGADASLQVFGTDISEAAIARARAGVYPDSIAADVSEERLQRFFVKNESGGYRVNKSVRDQCVFARQNLTVDPPFSQLDLISCRNVLIYLQPRLHSRIYRIFHYALKPNGFLFLGSAETAASATELFMAVDSAHRIYQRKETSTRPELVGFGRGAPPSPRVTAVPRRAPTERDVERHADQIVLSTHAPSGVVIDHQLHILQFRGRTARYLEPPTGAASFDLLKMIRPDLMADLRDAIAAAQRDGTRAVVEAGAPAQAVRIEVTPFQLSDTKTQYFIVLFSEIGDKVAASTVEPMRQPESADELRQVAELQQRLDAAERYSRAIKQEHESIVEDLRAANEEIQSSNEELQSTNEELETAKEELQSVNEELTTLNDELRDRNLELGVANDDLKNVFVNVQIPVIVVGNDLRIRRFTSAADRIANLVPTDLGRHLDEIRLHIDVPELSREVQSVIDTLEMHQEELQDKSGRWYSMTIRPYRASDNRIDGAVIVFHDIHAVKNHALALQVAGQYFETIVRTVRHPLLILDQNLVVVSANPAFCETFDTTSELVVHHPFRQISGGLLATPELERELAKVINGESFDGLEVSVQGEAETRWLVLSAQRLDFKSTRPPLILLAVEDVTVTKRAREREYLLGEATAALSATLSEAALIRTVAQMAVPLFADWCGLALIGANGKLELVESVFIDPAEESELREIAQASVELPAHPMHDVLRTGNSFLAEHVNDDLLHRLAPSDKALATLRQAGLRSVMIVQIAAAGQQRGILMFALMTGNRRYTQPDLSVAVELGRRAAVALDHVQSYAREAAARASAEAGNRAKRDFLATMSHELRTPLNAILGYAEILQVGVHGPLNAAQLSAVERIASSRVHLTKLIDQILQFAKLESGRIELETQDVPVSELLTAVADMVDLDLSQKGLTFTLHNCPSDTVALADPGALRQILVNLLNNARKFTTVGGNVTVTCNTIGDTLEIRVADTGIGIPADKLEDIFEPFFQVKETPNSPAQGMGLGLAISRDLARRMDGDLAAVSTLNKGATFILRLPIKVAAMAGGK